MPQPNKKRGRRMEGRKRKLEDGGDELEPRQSSKRRKSTDIGDNHDLTLMDDHDESLNDAYPPREKAFFGMLDDEEQEFFRNQLSKLENGSYEDGETPEIVLDGVYDAAESMELKIAQSQSCSRLMERMIHFATPIRLKKLFKAFRGK